MLFNNNFNQKSRINRNIIINPRQHSIPNESAPIDQGPCMNKLKENLTAADNTWRATGAAALSLSAAGAKMAWGEATKGDAVGAIMGLAMMVEAKNMVDNANSKLDEDVTNAYKSYWDCIGLPN